MKCIAYILKLISEVFLAVALCAAIAGIIAMLCSKPRYFPVKRQDVPLGRG